jgi:predicted nucleotidyltransferase
MNLFEKTLHDIDLFCSENNIEYILFGGIALIIHGVNRTTEDIDINLLVNLESLKEMGEKIITKFTPLFDNSIDFFSQNFVLPVSLPETSIRIDFTAGLSEFDKKAIHRKQRRKFGSVDVSVCTIEDLIIFKLFASRYKDLSDLENIATAYNESVDKNYLLEKIKEFELLDRNDMMLNFRKFFSF